MIRIVSQKDSEIRLSKDGRWFHQGQPFTNANVSGFFHRAIRRDEKGEYYLYNRHSDWEERVYFEVGDTAYFVWDLGPGPSDGRFRILLNTGSIEILNLRTLEEDPSGVMYCRIAQGDRARFSQNALHRLGDHAEADEGGIYVEEDGEKIYVSGGKATGPE